VVLLVVYPLMFKGVVKKNYESNKMWQGIYMVTEFYPDYFCLDTPVGQSQITYDKIYRILETKTNFYILVGKNQGVIIVKEDCPQGLDEYIRQLAKR